MHTYDQELLPEEIDILKRMTNLPIDVDAMVAVTNMYRAAQRMRTKMEREVLSHYGLSWNGFAMLYNLWIWDGMETRELERSMSVTRATVSSISYTLERKGLCRRKQQPHDRRLVTISLTEEGKRVMEELYPRFNQAEAAIVSGLTREEQRELTRLLRKVIKTMGEK